MSDTPIGLTDAEQLAALETYIKTLTVVSKELRAKVTKDMGAMKVLKVGAYLPDGTELGAVSRQPGNKTAKVTDQAAALKWCVTRYPGEIVGAINPAFLERLLGAAKVGGKVGDMGVDPLTGEMLPFIEVVQGAPFVRITTTDEGAARMEALAHGFAGMLEASKPPPTLAAATWAPDDDARHDPIRTGDPDAFPPALTLLPPPPSEPPPPRRPTADPTLSTGAHFASGEYGR